MPSNTWWAVQLNSLNWDRKEGMCYNSHETSVSIPLLLSRQPIPGVGNCCWVMPFSDASVSEIQKLGFPRPRRHISTGVRMSKTQFLTECSNSRNPIHNLYKNVPCKNVKIKNVLKVREPTVQIKYSWVLKKKKNAILYFLSFRA